MGKVMQGLFVVWASLMSMLCHMSYVICHMIRCSWVYYLIICIKRDIAANNNTCKANVSLLLSVWSMLLGTRTSMETFSNRWNCSEKRSCFGLSVETCAFVAILFTLGLFHLFHLLGLHYYLFEVSSHVVCSYDDYFCKTNHMLKSFKCMVLATTHRTSSFYSVHVVHSRWIQRQLRNVQDFSFSVLLHQRKASFFHKGQGRPHKQLTSLLIVVSIHSIKELEQAMFILLIVYS